MPTKNRALSSRITELEGRAGHTEGKHFFKSPEQASNYAKTIGDKPYTTTPVKVSPGTLVNGQPINPAGEGPGYFFQTEHIPRILWRSSTTR